MFGNIELTRAMEDNKEEYHESITMEIDSKKEQKIIQE